MEGRRHLGAAIGSRSFVTQYMQEKVNYWVSSVQKLSKIARVQPHVAYCALHMVLLESGLTFCALFLMFLIT